MARRTLTLDVRVLRALRPTTGVCLRWKYDPVSLSRTPEAAAGRALDRWVADVEEHWGPCGTVLHVDDEPAAYALYAPPAFLPGLGDVPTAPPSPDAVVLAELCLLPDAGGRAGAKQLLQAMARDLHGRDVAAVEAFGTFDRVKPEWDDESVDPGERCLAPVELLDEVGFATHRAHSTTPRLRMELRGARTWMSEVELALERLVGAVRPARSPGLGPPTARSEAPPVRSGLRAP